MRAVHEEEARKRAEEDAKRRAEEDDRLKRERAAAEKRKAEEDARKTAEQQARKHAEEEATRRLEKKDEPAGSAAAKAPAETPRRGRVVAEEEEETVTKKGVKAPAKAPAAKKGEGDRRRGKLTVTKALSGDDERMRSVASYKRHLQRINKGRRGGRRSRRSARSDDSRNHHRRRTRQPHGAPLGRRHQGADEERHDGDGQRRDRRRHRRTGRRRIRPHRQARRRIRRAGRLEGRRRRRDANLKPRPPVVTVMGHVDHGKTSLLDALRKTDVVAGEAGGITQHIGAYQVQLKNGQKITFLDTPGHAAFTAMRARGAKVTDLVILVVAADDGVMPQTVEAIAHAKAAHVPIIVAINKIDKGDADPMRVKTELLQHEIQVEDLGGETIAVEVSAKKGTDLDKLAGADPAAGRSARPQGQSRPHGGRGDHRSQARPRPRPGGDRAGAARHAESRRHRGGGFRMGPRAPVAERPRRNRAKAPVRRCRWKCSAFRRRRKRATNSPWWIPKRAPAKSPNTAAASAAKRARRRSRARRSTSCSRPAKPARSVCLPLVIKADVQGSAEAIQGALMKLGTDEVGAQVLQSGVGGITESDVILAHASGAAIIGFNVRADKQARERAKRDGVEIRYYNIIYNVVDDVKAALSGMLAPETREKFLGNAEILEVFTISKVGKVAGCRVTEGVVRRGAKVRLIRDHVVIHEGELSTLKRFKDEVREVQTGQECGMAFANYQDMQKGDIIEAFEVETIQRAL